MQIFLGQNLTFLAVPKAGSTAFETAFRPYTSIDVRSPPNDRHITAKRYRRTWEPFLKRVWDAEPETMAILREPTARLESWYRYRHAGDRAKSTAEMSFEEFVRASLKDSPPEAARIGKQDTFTCDKGGQVLVDHLFAIENPDPLHDFLAERFDQQVQIGARNISDPVDVSLSQEVEGALIEARAGEYALYETVAETGYLFTPQNRR
ncbi:MAG: sulfotransferase family 2 domain-containing protein [Pseudomonadota bacterium]